MTAVGIVVQILDGLRQRGAHARLIVHRDIKPPNILHARHRWLRFAEDPRLRRVEAAHRASPARLHGTAIASAGWRRPELFGGALRRSARRHHAVGSDVHEMLAGKLPFAARTYEELNVQVATTRPVPLHQVAPHVLPAIASSVDRGLRVIEAQMGDGGSIGMTLRGGLVGVTSPSPHVEADEHAVERLAQQRRADAAARSHARPDAAEHATHRAAVASTASRNERRARALGVVTAPGPSSSGRAGARRASEASTSVAAVVSSPTSTPISATTPDPTPRLIRDAAHRDSDRDDADGDRTHPRPGQRRRGVSFLTIDTVGAIKATEIDAFHDESDPDRAAMSTWPASAHLRSRASSSSIHDTARSRSRRRRRPIKLAIRSRASIGNVLKSVAGPNGRPPSGGGGIKTVEATLDPLLVIAAMSLVGLNAREPLQGPFAPRKRRDGRGLRSQSKSICNAAAVKVFGARGFASGERKARYETISFASNKKRWPRRASRT